MWNHLAVTRFVDIHTVYIHWDMQHVYIYVNRGGWREREREGGGGGERWKAGRKG